MASRWGVNRAGGGLGGSTGQRSERLGSDTYTGRVGGKVHADVVEHARDRCAAFRDRYEAEAEASELGGGGALAAAAAAGSGDGIDRHSGAAPRQRRRRRGNSGAFGVAVVADEEYEDEDEDEDVHAAVARDGAVVVADAADDNGEDDASVSEPDGEDEADAEDAYGREGDAVSLSRSFGFDGIDAAAESAGPPDAAVAAAAPLSSARPRPQRLGLVEICHGNCWSLAPTELAPCERYDRIYVGAQCPPERRYVFPAIRQDVTPLTDSI